MKNYKNWKTLARSRKRNIESNFPTQPSEKLRNQCFEHENRAFHREIVRHLPSEISIKISEILKDKLPDDNTSPSIAQFERLIRALNYINSNSFDEDLFDLEQKNQIDQPKKIMKGESTEQIFLLMNNILFYRIRKDLELAVKHCFDHNHRSSKTPISTPALNAICGTNWNRKATARQGGPFKKNPIIEYNVLKSISSKAPKPANWYLCPEVRVFKSLAEVKRELDPAPLKRTIQAVRCSNRYISQTFSTLEPLIANLISN